MNCFRSKSTKVGFVLAGFLFGGLLIAQGQDEVHVTQVKMVNARAMLSKGFDAKKAKQGDAITAKIENDVQLQNGQALPRNTVIMGHLDEVQASENKGDSKITVTFDKAQLKGAEPITIKAMIMGIAGPPNQTQITGLTPGSADQAAKDATVGIPGVVLVSSPGAANSGVLSSTGKNVHIPDGAQFTFGIAVIPAGAQVK